MYCTYCGKANDDDSRFCGYCGKPLEEYVPPAADAGRTRARRPSSASSGLDRRAALFAFLFLLLAAGAAVWFFRPGQSGSPTAPMEEYVHTETYYDSDDFSGYFASSPEELHLIFDAFGFDGELVCRKVYNLLGFTVSMTEYRYDSQGRVSRETTQKYGSLSSIKEYGYRADGAASGWTVRDASGRTIQTAVYAYSGDDRPTSLEVCDGDGNVLERHSYDYDVYGAEVRETITANDSTRIVETWENRKREQREPWPGASEATTYELLSGGRYRPILGEEHLDGGSVFFAEVKYDASGNPVSFIRRERGGDRIELSFSYAPDGKLMSVNAFQTGYGSGSRRFTYDDQGRLLSTTTQLPDETRSYQIERLASGKVKCTLVTDSFRQEQLYDKNGRLVS